MQDACKTAKDTALIDFIGINDFYPPRRKSTKYRYRMLILTRCP